MKLYFAWVDEREDFNPLRHALTDGEIFSFSLTEKEGAFPLVTIEIRNPYAGFLDPHQKQWCYVSCDRGKGIELLFKGKLCAVPHHLNREMIALNFTARPSHWEDQLQTLHQNLKGSPFWDSLFVEEEGHDDPMESLEARSELFFWCRKTGEVKLSNLFWGSHKVDLGEKHFYDSLKIRMGEPPLSAVNVSLSVEWIQHYRGETDLSPLIRSCFREGIVNTLTGEDLQAKWWQTNEKIGHSGYWVAKSDLKEITPNYTGDLNLYPAVSEPIWVSPEDPAYGKDKPSQPQQKRLKRSWFKANLVLGWIYRQKRREKVRFTLGHATQLSPDYDQRTRKLNLNLQNIASTDDIHTWHAKWNYSKGFRVVYGDGAYTCRRKHRSEATFEEDRHHWIATGKKPKALFSAHQGRFFSTDRGKKAIEYAIEIARAHLAASARAVEITVSGPIENFVDLTCDHSVKIKDHRLPGEEVWGKVKSLRLCMEGQSGKKWGEVILGVSIGTGEEMRNRDAPTLSHASYTYSMDYGSPDYQTDVLKGRSPSDIDYQLPQNQENQTRWIQPQALTARDLVQEMTVTNPASRQNKHLLRTQYPLSHNIEAALKHVPTTLHIRLLDLKPLGTMTEYIEVDIPYPWSSPRQIDLKASGQNEHLQIL
ncbi:MAG: hypothetical protein JNK42_03675 [Caedimonas sp.]|nr:hypothetical protein [Caedimonas sp.]